MKDTQICKVLNIEELIPDIFDVIIHAPIIAQQAACGQFLHIKCPERYNVFLRRPISICDIDRENGNIRFIFEVKGEGTESLKTVKVGDSIDVMGPLGTGFFMEDYKKPMIIGGGIGTYPLLALAKHYGEKAEVFLGFRNKDRLTLIDEFEAITPNFFVATDDGSYGHHGFAIELLEKRIKETNADVIMACGPSPMLKAVAQLSEKTGIRAQVSLEQRMGCGVGACLVCSCETKLKGTWKYKRVCKNGPVFWSSEVVL